MNRRRSRSLAVLSLTSAVAVIAATAASPADAGTRSGTSAKAKAAAACWPEVATDFDGGGPDVAIGLPGYDLPGKPDAGAIVIYSNVAAGQSPTPKAPTASRIYTADDFPGLQSAAHARFGAAVSVWEDWGADDDADDCNDLLVGAPGEAVDGQPGAGAVYQLRGAPGGLTSVRRTVSEDSLFGAGSAQAQANFGAAIAAETRSTVAIGEPGRDVVTSTSSDIDAGRVVRIEDFNSNHEGQPEVVQEGGAAGGDLESGDHFGSVLSLMVSGWGTQLVVGVPDEDIGYDGKRVDAGAVVLVPPKGKGDPSELDQDSLGAGGAAEAGDRFGASIDTYWTYDSSQGLVGVVVAGVPGEDVGSSKDAGSVAFARFTGPGDTRNTGPLTGVARTLTQNSPTIPGSVEAGDAFGSAVVAGPLAPSGDPLDLVIGSPLEDLGKAADAGTVTMTRMEPDGSPTPGAKQPAGWNQDSPGVSGAAEGGDRFGAALSDVALTQEQDDTDIVWRQLVVTVPREDIGGVSNAGMAYIGTTPGKGSVALVPPKLQTDAGIGMVPMRLGQQ